LAAEIGPFGFFRFETRNLSREVTRRSALSIGWRDHIADNGIQMSLCTSLERPMVSPDFGAVMCRSIGATAWGGQRGLPR
jgi:hypothetical protein